MSSADSALAAGTLKAPPSGVDAVPLYTEADARRALSPLHPVDFGTSVRVAADINVDLAQLGQPEVSYECATVPVPLDYDQPNGPTIQLSLVRLPAAGPASERVGSLFLNPGGPGGSGACGSNSS